MGRRGAPRKAEKDKKLQRMVGFCRDTFLKANRIARKSKCSRAAAIRFMIFHADEKEVIQELRGA